MKRSTFMTTSATVSLVYGLVALLATTQLVAACFLGYAVLNWLSRHTTDPVAANAIAVGNLVGWAFSLVVAIDGATIIPGTALMNLSTLAIQVIFTAGWGYYAFVRGGARRPAASEARVGLALRNTMQPVHASLWLRERAS